MLTDFVKIFLAKQIKNWFSPQLHLIASRIIGLLLIVFGVVLVIRVI
jgi:threonine/homoserine/homoserine lactone efflux protein